MDIYIYSLTIHMIDCCLIGLSAITTSLSCIYMLNQSRLLKGMALMMTTW